VIFGRLLSVITGGLAFFVMPALVTGIHAFLAAKTWMAGTSPAMTAKKARSSLAMTVAL
jgi:hypothetical protein